MSSVTHIINPGAKVSVVCARRSNKEISEFNNITMSTVKKDYLDFVKAGNSPKDYDILRKPHKCPSDAHNHKIVARYRSLSTRTPQSP